MSGGKLRTLRRVCRTLRYQLQTPVPPAWFPFLPQESGGSLVDFVAATIAGGSIQPWGRIISFFAGIGVDG